MPNIAAAVTCGCGTLVTCVGSTTDAVLVANCPVCQRLVQSANVPQFQGWKPPVVGGFHHRHAGSNAVFSHEAQPAPPAPPVTVAIAPDVVEASDAQVIDADAAARATEPAAPAETALEEAIRDGVSAALKATLRG